MFTCVLGRYGSRRGANLPEGADRVGGQLRADKECPFSGAPKPGRVWRKVPEGDARSVEYLWWAPLAAQRGKPSMENFPQLSFAHWDF